MLDRALLRDIEREGGLAHARPRRYNDQIRTLQTAGLFVQIVKARRDSRNFIFILRCRVDNLEIFEQHILYFGVIVFLPPLRDLKDAALRVIEDFPGRHLALVALFGDILRGADHLPHHRFFGDDLRVFPAVRGGRNLRGECRDIGSAADHVQRLSAF